VTKLNENFCNDDGEFEADFEPDFGDSQQQQQNQRMTVLAETERLSPVDDGLKGRTEDLFKGFGAAHQRLLEGFCRELEGLIGSQDIQYTNFVGGEFGNDRRYEGVKSGMEERYNKTIAPLEEIKKLISINLKINLNNSGALTQSLPPKPKTDAHHPTARQPSPENLNYHDKLAQISTKKLEQITLTKNPASTPQRTPDQVRRNKPPIFPLPPTLGHSSHFPDNDQKKQPTPDTESAGGTNKGTIFENLPFFQHVKFSKVKNLELC
jgi:hypothetical protein